MDMCNSFFWIFIFQRNANLFAGHKEFVFIVLENLAGESAGTGFLLSQAVLQGCGGFLRAEYRIID